MTAKAIAVLALLLSLVPPAQAWWHGGSGHCKEWDEEKVTARIAEGMRAFAAGCPVGSVCVRVERTTSEIRVSRGTSSDPWSEVETFFATYDACEADISTKSGLRLERRLERGEGVPGPR
jgi:hypothetical protein